MIRVHIGVLVRLEEVECLDYLVLVERLDRTYP
jgi:hypothetical protein